MTSQYPTQQQWLPQPPPTQPPKPPAKHGNGRKVLLIVAGVVVGLFLLGSLLAPDPAPTATPARAVQGTDAPAVTAPAETTPAETFDTPALADFKLTVKELSRQRFGSAGDLVEYRVEAGWSQTYDPDKEYELTYRISGGEDGSETQTMLIRGDEYEQYEGNASTRGGVKIKATPTGIEEV